VGSGAPGFGRDRSSERNNFDYGGEHRKGTLLSQSVEKDVLDNFMSLPKQR